ncbi:unnamed protein product [Callosobruchus maculatus]|uniref:Endonuclease/exonuclease/phosphatase domain-containing protein n=1 Tax=Callosobruchus maculatus TaxID=64391 RepID=A0A653DUP1_CALMS|nr:unnamed protein product [Callosobruchus maculatus]
MFSGYHGVYKKRTGQRTDGCAIYYKTDNVELLEHVTVEFYRKNVPILNRDNVGIVAKFAPKLHPTREFVVATTHLLYNPRRRDVRMAQMQLFLSEIERISFKNDSVECEHRYLPILITGDFNTPPNSDLYNFMVEGKIKYDNMPPGLLDNGSNLLVTSVLGISDTCQYVDLLKSRKNSNQLSRDEVTLIDLFKSEMNVKTCPVDQTKPTGLFKTGKLSHNFAFKSVYNHGGLRLNEATTNQDGWITVDYIFYSTKGKYTDERLQLLARCRLPTSQELGNTTIPNQALGSDHLSLAAKFKLLF